MVPVGRAVPAAPRTKPTTSDGAGRVAYNPARPGLQDGHPGPAAVAYPATAAAVLPPAAPLLPPTTPTLPPAAPVLHLAAPVLPPAAPVLPPAVLLQRSLLLRRYRRPPRRPRRRRPTTAAVLPRSCPCGLRTQRCQRQFYWPSRRPSTGPRGRKTLPGVGRKAADTRTKATPTTVQARRAPAHSAASTASAAATMAS